VKNTFAKTNVMEHDEVKRLKKILTSLGKLVMDLGDKEKGDLVMSILSSSK